MVNISDLSTFNTLIKNNSVVVVKFYADWCGPCKLYATTFSSVADQYEDSVPFVSVNVDTVPELSSMYGIRSVPTTVVLKDGVVHKSSTGALSDIDIKNLIN